MVAGYIMTCFGLGGIIYLSIASSTYRNREALATLWIIYLAIFFIGLFITIIATVNKKKKEKLLAAQNIVGTDTQGNPIYRGQCPMCKLNVADNCFTCPQCGQRIR